MKSYNDSTQPDFRLLFESVPGLHLVVTPDLVVVAVSNAYAAAAMKTHEEITGRHIFELFSNTSTATDIADLQASLYRVLHNKTADTMAVRRGDIHRPDLEGGGFEERYWCLSNLPVLDADHNLAYIIHRMEDVTELIHLQQHSQKQHQHTQHQQTAIPTDFSLPVSSYQQRAVAGTPPGLADEHKPRVLLLCNDTPELLDGIVLQLRDFCQIQAVTDSSNALEVVRNWQPALVLADIATPHTNGVELCRSIKSNPDTAGIVVVLLASLAHREALPREEAPADEYLFKPFHPSELVARIKSLLRAISERRRYNRELMQKNQELTRVNNDLQAFSYSVSHDLRAPLRAITSYTQILGEEYNPLFDEEARRMMNAIVYNTWKMGQLIDGLLAFAQLDKRRMRRRKVDMTTLARSTADMLRSSMPAAGEIVIYPLLPTMADNNLVEYVFANLIGNAVKYSSREEHPRVAVSSFLLDNEVVYCITDNGTGFDMKYYNKLFGVFQRLHAAGEFEGTGIGLALVQRIISKHDGRIWATSVPGRGATFFFSLGGSTQEGAYSALARHAPTIDAIE